MTAVAFAQHRAEAQEFLPGRLIVKYDTNQAHLLIAARYPAAKTRALSANSHLFSHPGLDARGTLALAAELNRTPGVVYAEPDYIRRPTSLPQRKDAIRVPNDPRFADQWALQMVHAPSAWHSTIGDSAVTVAVLDTGVVDHPDLRARLVPGYDFISDAENGGDGDGRDPDATDAGNPDEGSSSLHGTHVAGIIGADTDNQVGVSGVDWRCAIEPIRVLGVERGLGLDSDIADAIRWAAGLHINGVPDNRRPAQVINLSFGGSGHSRTMQDAISDAIAHGAIVVAAAGNLGENAKNDSPAGLSGVITVGAVDDSGTPASYSNFGEVVSVMAPGGGVGGDGAGVLSTLADPDRDATYGLFSGTSQAAPFVSGAVALMKAVHPTMSARAARQFLEAAADPSARCAMPENAAEAGCGAGLLNIAGSVALAEEAELSCGAKCDPPQLASGGCAVANAHAGLTPSFLLLVCATLLLRRRNRARGSLASGLGGSDAQHLESGGTG